LNRPDDRGWTPLHLGVLNGHQRTVDLLIAAGCDCAAASTCGGWTAFHVAAQMNNVKIGRRVLSSDSALPVDFECHGGITAAMIAAKLGHAEFLDFCLERGADPNRMDRRGYPILHVTVLSESLAAVEVVLSHGVDPSSVQGRDGSTALHLASALQLTHIIARLLDFPCPWSSLSPVQRVALYRICYRDRRNDIIERRQDPIYFCLQLNYDWVPPPDSQAFNLIHRRKPDLLRYDQAELAEFFLVSGELHQAASLFKKGVQPKNPSHMLKYPMSAECLDILWGCGASPTFKFEDGSNALHHWPWPNRDGDAGFMGDLWGRSDIWPFSRPACRWLIDPGVDVNAQDINGETPFMKLVETMDVNLHFVNFDCTEMLINAGSNLHLRRNDGMTALDLAKKKGAHFVAQIIKAAMKVDPR
jgi:ankyrin repeat protein